MLDGQYGRIAMADWLLPSDFVEDRPLRRVMVSDTRTWPWTCDDQLAAKSRPSMRPVVPQPSRLPGLELFDLGVVNDVLDAAEFQGLSVDDALEEAAAGRRPVHGGLRAWVRHAVAQYLEAHLLLQEKDCLSLVPVKPKWVVQYPRDTGGGAPVLEVSAWGRRYCSADRQVRELRLLRRRSVKDRERDDVEVATALYVLAQGRATRGLTRFDVPHVLVDAVERSCRLRVVEIGCEDGSVNVLDDVDVDEAQRRYQEFGQSRASAVVRGGGQRNPGSSCQKCKLIDGCPALPRADGILGVAERRRQRRTWSVTNGRTYVRCAAQEYLTRLNLPRNSAVEYGEPARRGQAVHAWIERNHRRRPVRACTAVEVPDGDSWQVGRWQVAGSQALLGAQMIGDHALVCPLHHLPLDTPVDVERTVTAFDADANVVVIAKIDLVYRDGAAWVLREVKTAERADEGDPLARYPQLSLGLLLLAHDVLGDGSASGRVELERLTPAGPAVERFHPTNTDHVEKARQVVHDLAAGWHADTAARAQPGPECRRCAVARWCPDAFARPRPEDTR